ncbi:MAG: hypothetical protein KDG55_05135 [Rhodocyclaceae bacterium]|nr:hypothetical protein [Rhodocyclaceae bacterium]
MKKKRKKLLPLGIKNQVKTELPALVALEAVGQPWFCEAHLTDMMSVAMVCMVLAEAGSDIHAAASTLFVELGKEQLDAEVLRPLVGKTSVWLQRQPNGKVERAIDELLGTQCKGV